MLPIVVLFAMLCAGVYLLFMQNIKLQDRVTILQQDALKNGAEIAKSEFNSQTTNDLTNKVNKLEEDLKQANNRIVFHECENTNIIDAANELVEEVTRLNTELEQERVNNQTILSQKKSSEVRLGNIGESLVPFLEGFKYDPSKARFLGMPLDYIIFDTDSAEPSIVLLEVKTGNSQLSPTQRAIKNLVKKGAVRFEEFRISDKGIKIKTSKNDDEDK